MDTFLGRVTKARILQAVSEAKGKPAADRIEHLKKGEMATEAETLLADTGWLPEPLRTPDGSKESAVPETAEHASEKELADEEEPAAHNRVAREHDIAAE